MNYKFDFVHHRNKFFLITLVSLLVCVGSLVIQGLNLGIDFVSGTRVDIHIDKPYDLEQARGHLETLGYSDPNVRKAGNDGQLLIFRTNQVLNLDKINEIRSLFQKEYGKQVGVNEQKVEPIVGQELAKNAILSVLIASVGIILYITLRFEYRFAIAAVLALLYDALFVIGMFSLFQLEVDLVFIAAILTIVGYSVNDTIVIFDRIRENLKQVKPKKWEELASLVNNSIQQTLVRSINTVMTVIFAAAALYLFGGESIKNFALALLLGLFSGAFSSIFLASQIWVIWKWRSMEARRERLKAHPAE